MSFKLKIYLMFVLMLLTAILGNVYKPSTKIADKNPSFTLNSVIPNNFSNWQVLQDQVASIVTPEQQQALANAYSQTLSRTYVNDKGEKVMLAIAYGEVQNEQKNVHYPETCYPAQGFKLNSNNKDLLVTSSGKIRVRRLTTSMGNRYEPITYWVVVNNEVILSDYENRLKQVKYGIRGLIPDGLLFRVSNISNTPNSYDADFKLHNNFIDDLLLSLNSSNRLKLSGLE